MNRWLATCACRMMVALAAVCIAGSAVAADASTPAHSSFTIDSKVLGETRTINVYVPPGYNADTSVRYPVLYMPDGGMQEDFPHVAADMDAGIRASKIRPMLVIGIENTERRRDMTGPTEVASDREIAPHVGGATAFRRFIANELMPQVRHRYRTNGRTAERRSSANPWRVCSSSRRSSCNRSCSTHTSRSVQACGGIIRRC